MAPYALWSSDRSLSPDAIKEFPRRTRRSIRARMNDQVERDREQHPVG